MDKIGKGGRWMVWGSIYLGVDEIGTEADGWCKDVDGVSK